MVLVICLSTAPLAAQEKSRVDLDDVQIQGELLSDQRLRLMARGRNSIADQIKIRTSFREEILENLPVYFHLPKETGHDDAR
jgi:hypothetical protein